RAARSTSAAARSRRTKAPCVSRTRAVTFAPSMKTSSRARAGRRRSGRSARRLAGEGGACAGGKASESGGWGATTISKRIRSVGLLGEPRGKRGRDGIVGTRGRLDVLFDVHAVRWTSREVADSGRARGDRAGALHVGLHSGRRAHLGAIREARRVGGGLAIQCGRAEHGRSDAASVGAAARAACGGGCAGGAGAREDAGPRRV